MCYKFNMNLSYPHFDKYTLKKVTNVLKSGKVNYWTGNECKKFEKEFSNYHNIKYSVAVSNGSVALELALKSLNLSSIYLLPVEPNPPDPRSVSSSSLTSFKTAFITGHKTICAIRNPFSTLKIFSPKFTNITFNSPL